MKLASILLAVACAAARAQTADVSTRVQSRIDAHLGRPYVWGATGIKSFDCSGFVWRVYAESGAFMKRTTARKLWFSLPAPAKGKENRFGNLVFFDDLHHIGIVRDDGSFYHAAKTTGTALTPYRPYWGRLKGGIRASPIKLE